MGLDMKCRFRIEYEFNKLQRSQKSKIVKYLACANAADLEKNKMTTILTKALDVIPMTTSLQIFLRKTLDSAAAEDRYSDESGTALIASMSQEGLITMTPSGTHLMAIPELVRAFDAAVCEGDESDRPKSGGHESQTDETIRFITDQFAAMARSRSGEVMDSDLALISTALSLEQSGQAVAYERNGRLAWKGSASLLADFRD
jgi:hypothetical protein